MFGMIPYCQQSRYVHIFLKVCRLLIGEDSAPINFLDIILLDGWIKVIHEGLFLTIVLRFHLGIQNPRQNDRSYERAL